MEHPIRSLDKEAMSPEKYSSIGSTDKRSVVPTDWAHIVPTKRQYYQKYGRRQYRRVLLVPRKLKCCFGSTLLETDQDCLNSWET